METWPVRGLDAVVEDLEGQAGGSDRGAGAVELRRGADEDADLVRRDAVRRRARVSQLADALAISSSSVCETSNRRGGAVEDGDGVAPLLGVAVDVGDVRRRAGDRPACGSGARCGS